MKTKVLVVVDMQNDFISGSLGSPEAEKIVDVVCEKIRKANEDNIPIFVTKDTHGNNYMDTFEGKRLPIEHCIRDTEGWQNDPRIEATLKAHQVVIKGTFGAMTLPTYIHICSQNDVSEIEVCGLCTDICVINNVALLRAAFPDIPIIVDSKACAGTSIEAHNAALLVMKSLQIDVI